MSRTVDPAPPTVANGAEDFGVDPVVQSALVDFLARLEQTGTLEEVRDLVRTCFGFCAELDGTSDEPMPLPLSDQKTLLRHLGLRYARNHARILTGRGKAISWRLSPREREVIFWLAKGLRPDRIAEKMGIARVTVDLHLTNARRKLKAATPEQAVAAAVSLGIA